MLVKTACRWKILDLNVGEIFSPTYENYSPTSLWLEVLESSKLKGLVIFTIKNVFSKTHDVCYSMEGAKRTSRKRCDKNFGRNLDLACKYIINSRGLTFDQCIRKAHFVHFGCNLLCFIGFNKQKKQCKIYY